MGLLKATLLAPLAPVRSVVWLAERLEQEALAQIDGPQAARLQLEELYQAYDRGEIASPEFDAEEERLLRQLMPSALTTSDGGRLAAAPTDPDGKWNR